MISASVLKVVVSTCQSNAIYSILELQKRCRNCLCGTFENAVLWIGSKPSSVFLNFSRSFLSILVFVFRRNVTAQSQAGLMVVSLLI